MKFLFLRAGPLLVLFACSTLFGDTIGPNNCASCLGVAYTLTYNPVSSTSTTQTFQITMDLNTAGFNVGTGDFLNAVAFKVADGANILGVTAISEPTLPVGQTWSAPAVNSTLNAGGCSSAGGSGFICVQSSGTGVTVPHTGAYDFVFNVTVNTGTLFTSTLGAHVKALYVNGSGKQVGITSEDITLQPGNGSIQGGPVPEPSSVLMGGTGLLLVSFLMRRRMRQGNSAAK